jgi:hypothetical protein
MNQMITCAFVQTIVPFQVCTSIYIRFNPIVMKKYEMLFCCGVFCRFPIKFETLNSLKCIVDVSTRDSSLSPEKFESDVIISLLRGDLDSMLKGEVIKISDRFGLDTESRELCGLIGS